ncbi:MAG: hydrogenase maturation protease [Candidatus Promineifilaceae bacterium]|nr:hydrogenase maturation protease [Candidatus Promineifilaceae bacterium]
MFPDCGPREAGRRAPPLRTAIVGVGHELRGDDAAGVLVARAVAARAGAHEHVLILEGRAAPENSTGALRRFRPDRVLVVDAVEMGASPGTVRCIDCSAAEGLSASTHTLPLDVFLRYLRAELDCDVTLIGIQPEQTWLDASVSPAVERAIEEALLVVLELLQEELPA